MKNSKLVIHSKQAPVVEIDPEAGATYVYFQNPRKKVATTVNRCHRGMIINVDLDSNNEVIGIESIGAKEISISKLLECAKINAPRIDFSQTRFRATPDLAHAQ